MNSILVDAQKVLTSPLFWRVIAAGVLFSIEQLYPVLTTICNTLIAALSVTIIVNGGEKIGNAFAGK
jgi:hypothetical protein